MIIVEIGDSAEGGGGTKRDPTRGGTGGTGGQGPGECDDDANMPAVGTYVRTYVLTFSLLFLIQDVITHEIKY